METPINNNQHNNANNGITSLENAPYIVNTVGLFSNVVKKSEEEITKNLLLRRITILTFFISNVLFYLGCYFSSSNGYSQLFLLSFALGFSSLLYLSHLNKESFGDVFMRFLAIEFRINGFIFMLLPFIVNLFNNVPFDVNTILFSMAFIGFLFFLVSFLADLPSYSNNTFNVLKRDFMQRREY